MTFEMPWGSIFHPLRDRRRELLLRPQRVVPLSGPAITFVLRYFWFGCFFGSRFLRSTRSWTRECVAQRCYSQDSFEFVESFGMFVKPFDDDATQLQDRDFVIRNARHIEVIKPIRSRFVWSFQRHLCQRHHQKIDVNCDK